MSLTSRSCLTNLDTLARVVLQAAIAASRLARARCPRARISSRRDRGAESASPATSISRSPFRKKERLPQRARSRVASFLTFSQRDSRTANSTSARKGGVCLTSARMALNRRQQTLKVTATAASAIGIRHICASQKPATTPICQVPTQPKPSTEKPRYRPQPPPRILGNDGPPAANT